MLYIWLVRGKAALVNEMTRKTSLEWVLLFTQLHIYTSKEYIRVPVGTKIIDRPRDFKGVSALSRQSFSMVA